MSDPHSIEESMANLSRDEVMSALFANLVVQQTNMAFMFMGRVPHPETGEVMQDLESAKFFIDQLEMIEAKTKGNLDKREENLLKQSLTALRMAFVEAVEKPAQVTSTEKKEVAPPKSETPKIESSTQTSETKLDDESKEKFSKKY